MERNKRRKADAQDYAPVITRGLLPELLHVEDVAIALAVRPRIARRWISTGKLGPYCRIGKRLVLRRDALLEAITAKEKLP